MPRERIEDDEIVINLADLWQALKKHKQFIAKVTGACVLAGAVLTFAVNPGYEATAMLKVQPPRSLNKSMLDTMELTNDRLAAQYMATYGHIMTSRSVIYEVIRGLKAPEDEGKDIDSLYEGYTKRIKTSPVKNATVMQVTITGKEEENTKQFTNLLLQTFFTKVSSMEQGNSINASSFVSSQLQAAKQNMEKAEENLRSFQTEHKVLSPEEDVRVASQKINMANSIKADSEVGMRAAQAKLDEINTQLAANGTVLADNDIIAELRKKLAGLASEKVSLENKFTQEHPSVIDVNERIAGVQAELDREIARVANMEATSTNKAFQDLLTAKVNSEVTVAVNKSKLEAVKKLEEEYAQNLAILSANRQKYAQLTREVAVAKDIYSMLRKRMEESKVAASADSGAIQVVDVPVVNKAKRKGAMKLGLALMLGLLGSCGWVIAKELMNPTIKRIGDIEDRLGLRVLANIAGNDVDKLNSYRKLRSSIMALTDMKTIMFTSSISGEGRTTICQSLADLLAKTGFKIALVNTNGLVGLCQGGTLMTTDNVNLHKAVQEQGLAEGGEILASKSMSNLLDNLKAAYDYIIIDAPALDATSDAVSLGSKVDGVIDLIRAGMVNPEHALRDLDELEQVGAKMLGAVLLEE